MLLKLLKKLFSRSLEEKAFGIAKRFFVYVPDKNDEWKCYDRIDQRFEGDCEDFAFTLQKQIGGQVWRVKVKQDWHAVLVKDGIVYCNMRERPVKRSKYDGIFRNEMKYDER